MKELERYHNQNHNGIRQTLSHFRKKLYTLMDRLIQNYINQCEICLSINMREIHMKRKHMALLLLEDRSNIYTWTYFILTRINF